MSDQQQQQSIGEEGGSWTAVSSKKRSNSTKGNGSSQPAPSANAVKSSVGEEAQALQSSSESIVDGGKFFSF